MTIATGRFAPSPFGRPGKMRIAALVQPVFDKYTGVYYNRKSLFCKARGGLRPPVPLERTIMNVPVVADSGGLTVSLAAEPLGDMAAKAHETSRPGCG